jgi:glycosyltransferase involved in cell wall biosynthesis
VDDYHVHRDKIQLCYNGIDITEFSPEGRSSQNPIVIGGVYALRPEKSIETLIDAFALVRAGRPQIRLHITGSGSMEKSLRERIAVLGIGESVLLNPATADVGPRMREIDIFVLPSVSEALSNSLMEAMACGCAVTASCVGGNPELVAEGETGLLFKPGDAAGLASNLERLVDDETLRRRVAAQGAEFIRTRFSIAAAAARMEEIYMALLTKSN